MINLKKSWNKFSNASKAFKAGFWFTICNVLQRGIQFLTTPIYTRLLSTEDYGMYSVFITWLNIITVFATLNLSSGPYYNGMLKYEKEGDEYTSSVQTLGVLCTVVCFLAFTLSYPMIGNFIGLSYNLSALMFVVTLVQPAFQFWSVQQRLCYKYKSLILATIINSLLSPVVGIALVILGGYSYEGIIYGYVTGNLIVCGCFFIRNYIKGRQLYSYEYWHYATKLGIPLIPHYLSQMILGQSDRVMIKYFCGASEAGIYTLAYQVSLIMNLLISGINNSLNPWMYRNLKDKSYEQIKRATTQLILLVGILSGGAMLIAPEIVGILGTKKYLDAVWVIPPVMFSTCITFVYCIWGTVLFYFEETKKVAVATSSGAVLNVILNAILIPKFGFIVAAYTTLIGYTLITFFYWRFLNRVCESKDVEVKELFDFRMIMCILLALFLISMIVLVLYNFSNIVRYLVLLVIIVAVAINRRSVMKILKNTRIR
ncbi:MAG: oligosaccharide flippase family protein [Clostridiales bacterium]|nr:oligosaccharide flippase family protein [Clostridiales bacterium]